MAIKHLVDESNIARYCRPTLIHRDGTLDGDAFRLRPNETNLLFTGLSALRAWLRINSWIKCGA